MSGESVSSNTRSKGARRRASRWRAFRSTKMVPEKEKRGQGMVEYALIMILVALVIILILALFGPAIGNMFSNVVSNV